MKFHHCPNPECSKFADQNNQKWYWKRGNYYSKAQGKIQRYQCKTCRKTFTPRTFSIDYCTKRPFNYSKLTSQLISASGINDISRKMKVSVSNVINRCERLARNYIAIHAELLDETMAEHARPASEEFLPENIAADRFESFSQSQYFSHHINIFAGEKSEYIYALGFSNLRRKGRMTFAQKSKRSLLETLEKADPQAIESSFRNVTEYIIQLLDKHKVTKPKQLTTTSIKPIQEPSPRLKISVSILTMSLYPLEPPETSRTPYSPSTTLTGKSEKIILIIHGKQCSFPSVRVR